MSTTQVLGFRYLIPIIGIVLIGLTTPASVARTANDSAEIEFRRAEWLPLGLNTTDPSTEQYRGEQYRVAKSPELKVSRRELLEVIVLETEPGRYGLELVVDRSLWKSIESITTASLESYLAIFIHGSFLFVTIIQAPIRDGRIFVSFHESSKEEVFDIARRFTPTPQFVPLEGTKGR